MASSSPCCCRRRRCEEPSPPAMDWAVLPHDILAIVFLKLGIREVMESAEFACKSWRRVALEEPALWRRLKMPMVRRSRGWRAIVGAAVERSAGQCVAFSGPCDNQTLIHLGERAPLLQSLDLFDYVACNDVLIQSITQLHFLEDLEISPAYNCSQASRKLFQPICQACPHLKRLVIGYQMFHNSWRGFILDNGVELAIPVMHELRYLELYNCELTQKVLSDILDSCSQLESLHIVGSVTGRHHRWLAEKIQLQLHRLRNLTLPGHTPKRGENVA